MKRLTLATTSAIAMLAAGTAMAVTDVDALDLNNDDFASLEEVKFAYPDFDVAFWDEMDLNGDNRLDAQEVVATEAQNILARYDMIPLEQRTAKVVLDADGDGFISIEDMRRGYPTFSDLDFEAIDLNDDNRVSYEEIYMTEAQSIIGRYEVGTVLDIAAIDTDGDDFADFDEMVVAFPGLDATGFEEIDSNDDNRISAVELYAPEAQVIVSRY